MPSLDLQKEYAKTVVESKQIIASAQTIIDKAKDKKAEIVRKYL